MATSAPLRRPKASGAMKRLDPAEQIQLLSQLLKAHPELRAEAEAMALAMITNVGPATVADAVVQAFRGFGQAEILQRARKDLPEGGYFDPVKVAIKICEEKFEPFMEGLERLISMGEMKAGLAQVKGMLHGLYDIGAGFPQEADEFRLKIGAFHVLEVWAKKAPEDLNPALAEWFQFEAPVDWASHLELLWRGLRGRFGKPR